jgi:uncharacterized protein (DUF983 family)
MTREHRLVLSLDEITGVRWQCTKCGSAISFPLDQSIRLTPTCQACHEPLTEAASFAEFQAVQAFVDALKGTLRGLRANKLGATLKLELLDTD